MPQPEFVRNRGELGWVLMLDDDRTAAFIAEAVRVARCQLERRAAEAGVIAKHRGASEAVALDDWLRAYVRLPRQRRPLQLEVDEDTLPVHPMTVAQAAAVIGCTEANVRKLAARGVLDAVKVGAGWLIERTSVIAHRDRRR